MEVGKSEDVMKRSSPFITKIIDLKGRVMLPGFIDPHVHMTFSMIDHWLDLSPFSNKNMDLVKNKLIKAIKIAD